MAIFKSISSFSNSNVSMKSNLIANQSGSSRTVGFSNDGISCFGCGFDGSFGGRNINIIDIDINQFGLRRRCC